MTKITTKNVPVKKSLIPMNYQVMLGNYLRNTVKANEPEIKELQDVVEKSLERINERVKDEVTYAGFPVVVLSKCPCPHNCNKYNISGVDVCEDAAKKMILHFPEITTSGVNSGRLWKKATEINIMYNWVGAASEVINKKFNVKEQALVRKHFGKHFKGYKFIPVKPVKEVTTTSKTKKAK